GADDFAPEMREELGEDALADFDDKIQEESFDIPETTFDEIESQDDSGLVTSEFDDLEEYIDESEKAGTVTAAATMDSGLASKPVEEIESEFDNLSPVGEARAQVSREHTLDELEGFEEPLSDDFNAIPDMAESAEPEEPQPFEEPAFEEPAVMETEELPDFIEEPVIQEPIIEEPEPVVEEVPAMTSSSDELSMEDFAKQFGEEPVYEEPTQPETIETFEAEAPAFKEEEQKVMKESLNQTEPPVEQEKDELDFSEQEMAAIQRSLNALPHPLSEIATDTIVEEKLPVNDLKYLCNKLISSSPPEEIKEFIEDRLGIVIPMKRKATARPSSTKSTDFASIAKIGMVAALLAALGVGIFFLYGWYEKWDKSTDLYELGLSQISRGPNHYREALQTFNKAKGGGDPNLDWLNRYAEKFVRQGNPRALYYAHKMLLGNRGGEKTANKDWLNRYEEVAEILRKNPGQEEAKKKKPEEPKKYREIDLNNYGAVDFDAKNEKIRFLIADMFSKKAMWAAKKKNWSDVKTYYENAIRKGYDPLLKLDPDDHKVMDKKARLYVEWGKLIGSSSDTDMRAKFKDARDLYFKIKRQDPENPYALYGLLNVYLAENDEKNIKASYKAIEEADPSQLDEKALTKYAYHLTLTKDKKQRYDNLKKAKEILNRVIQDGQVYPEAYYYLGLIYGNQRDPSKSLESYIKGLFAYYYQDDKEGILRRLNKARTADEQANALEDLTINAIIAIKNDKNPENAFYQSRIFNNIGLNYLEMSEGLRTSIPGERDEKEELIDAAKTNFKLAIYKDPKNYEPYKHIGDLKYLDSISKGKRFVNLKERYKFPKKYYLQALELIIDNKYENRAEHQLWPLLVKGVSDDKVDPQLFYKLGYIFYKEGKHAIKTKDKEKNYRYAAEIWHSIKNNRNQKFNPNLNFALGNSYLRLNQIVNAIRHYILVIEFYAEVTSRYNINPDPNSLRQNEVFAKLARAHNNLGVAYHLLGEKEHDNKFMELAQEHYFKAREAVSKLNNDTFIKELELNSNKIYNNLVFVRDGKDIQTDRISLKRRLAIRNQLLKQGNRDVRFKGDKLISSNPLDHMMIEDMENKLKNN
ncbi:MAG: hypothetical protein OEZ36_02710, partial [Spirochaetota bacterium]|nr:hypothetical protein [Spirochaetota bacterium]